MPKNKNRCSFCGRADDEVSLLVSGINGFICNDCIQQAYQIVQEANGVHEVVSKDKWAASINWKSLPRPADIKAYLDQYVIGQDDA